LRIILLKVTGFGTHYMPPGTWSDDSSLTFCLAESLVKGYNLNDIADLFIKWLYENRWTPHGRVFDVGNTTREAISRLKQGYSPVLAGGLDEDDNGNGSLMRILPLAFYLLDKAPAERWQYVKDVSSITHGHIRSVMACYIYIDYAINLIKWPEKREAYRKMQEQVNEFFPGMELSRREINMFRRVLEEDISLREEHEISSSGYVLCTLEASLWCLLRNKDYRDTVLQAVNLGDDTDTTAAVAGGLAGLLYGFNGIPGSWIDQLAKKDEIMKLADELQNTMS
jgi:ADP-ribosyl-[dinitrogen reductase] hydrolase